MTLVPVPPRPSGTSACTCRRPPWRTPPRPLKLGGNRPWSTCGRACPGRAGRSARGRRRCTEQRPSTINVHCCVCLLRLTHQGTVLKAYLIQGCSDLCLVFGKRLFHDRVVLLSLVCWSWPRQGLSTARQQTMLACVSPLGNACLALQLAVY